MSTSQNHIKWMQFQTSDGTVRVTVRVRDLNVELIEQFILAGLFCHKTWVENEEGEVVS